jgi:hypothetical protein
VRCPERRPTNIEAAISELSVGRIRCPAMYSQTVRRYTIIFVVAYPCRPSSRRQAVCRQASTAPRGRKSSIGSAGTGAGATLLDGLAEALALLADGMGRAIDAAHAALVRAVTVAQATGV